MVRDSYCQQVMTFFVQKRPVVAPPITYVTGPAKIGHVGT